MSDLYYYVVVVWNILNLKLNFYVENKVTSILEASYFLTTKLMTIFYNMVKKLTISFLFKITSFFKEINCLKDTELHDEF